MGAARLTKVFISYRREDTTAGFAALLHDRLSTTLAADVFRDVDNLPLGEDWEAHIEEALRECDVALVLIGTLWLTVTDAGGSRRLDDPADVLRLEIASVLRRRRVRVIPVLFGAARLPRVSELPQDIRALAARNAFFWRLDQGSAGQLDKIEQAVQLGPIVPPGTRRRAIAKVQDPPTQIGGALSARVMALCAELLEAISDTSASREIGRIARGLQRPAPKGAHVLADAAQADAALEDLDTLSWSSPALRFIADQVEELRQSGPDMQMIELAKWYERAASGEVDLPPDKRLELKRVLTGRSPAERLGLRSSATSSDVRAMARSRALGWRAFASDALTPPMAQRAAAEVVHYYEELAFTNGLAPEGALHVKSPIA